MFSAFVPDAAPVRKVSYKLRDRSAPRNGAYRAGHPLLERARRMQRELGKERDSAAKLLRRAERAIGDAGEAVAPEAAPRLAREVAPATGLVLGVAPAPRIGGAT